MQRAAFHSLGSTITGQGTSGSIGAGMGAAEYMTAVEGDLLESEVTTSTGISVKSKYCGVALLRDVHNER